MGLELLHPALAERRATVTMGKWLAPHHHHHPPLLSPVSRHSHRLNFYIGIVFVVLMVVSVVALFCCCYHLEWRLRIQSRGSARRSSRRSNQGALPDVVSQEMSSPHGKKVEEEANLSVLMPGDSIPRFLAWANPHGSPDHDDIPDQVPRPAKDDAQISAAAG